MFDKPKSTAIRKGINMMLNGRYGEVQALELDSKLQRIDLKLQLNGESEVVDIVIGQYEVNDQDPEQPVIILRNIEISRPWMQELANDHVEGKIFDIPPKMSGMIKLVL